MFGAHCTVRGLEHYTQGLSGHKDHGSLPRPRKSLIRNATSSRPRQGARTGDFLDYKAWNFKIFVSEENVD